MNYQTKEFGLTIMNEEGLLAEVEELWTEGELNAQALEDMAYWFYQVDELPAGPAKNIVKNYVHSIDCTQLLKWFEEYFCECKEAA